MKRINKYIAITCILLSFVSCEEIVNIDLAQVDPKDVVDASVTENSPCIVLLTRSHGFYDSTSYARIPGARIELSNDRGESEIFGESSKEAGLYVSSMIGEAGHTYKLKITSGNNIYEAQATIPGVVAIDSVYIYRVKLGGDLIFSPCVVFRDPPDEENFYYSALYVNGKSMKSIYLDSDEHRNGLKVENILFYDKEDNNDEELKAGNQLRIEMQTLDKDMYTFYRSLRSVAAGGGTNPLTNITGGALGCFKAYNSTFVDYTVTEDDVK
jgi:hypothetical protein